MKKNVLSILIVILGVIVTAACVIYLATDQMIPGLIPLCAAAMMVPMMLCYDYSKHKLTCWLLFAAMLLNLAAGILQIILV